VVCTASRTKNFSPAELEALVESAKRFAVITSWCVHSKCILFPWVMFWGIHSMWHLRVERPSTFCFLEVSGTQPSAIESVQDCTTSCEVLRWFASLHAHAERVTMSSRKKSKGVDTLCSHEVASILLIPVTSLWIIQENVLHHQSDHEWLLGSSW
jgi:hypothetical protein